MIIFWLSGRKDTASSLTVAQKFRVNSDRRELTLQKTELKDCA